MVIHLLSNQNLTPLLTTSKQSNKYIEYRNEEHEGDTQVNDS